MLHLPEHLVAFSSLILLAPTTLPNSEGTAPAQATVCDAPAPSLPASITLQEGLAPIVRWTLQNSPTFRQQCRILAATPDLRATVRVARPEPGVQNRARATMRDHGGRMVVEIEILKPSDVAELLGHEFEHVIEHIDRVDLAAVARRGEARQMEDGAFETRRAIAVGQKVSGEVLNNAPDRMRRASRSIWRAVRAALRGAR
ncbi:MAG TPA: hypothetical protein VFJ02_12720 [Vicinamibacterales bacterium]|nr:hypothetical protein [Vicinamibacterales bacterium]